MSWPDSVTLVEAASLDVGTSVAETMRDTGVRDERFGSDLVTRTARLAVAAWAMAVDGDDSTLTAIGQPDAVHWLMHPVRKPWQVAPGPRVTRIEIWDLNATEEPPLLRLMFHFTGRRRFTDPGQADRAGDNEMPFVGSLRLTLTAAGRRSWRLSSGHISTLDEYLGYAFTARRETSEEHRERTGAAAAPAAGSGPAPAASETERRFRLAAGFAEHDERFGSSVEIEVQRATAPDRDEAKALVWPAIAAKTASVLGEGDWRPSLSWLDVVELLDDAHG